MPRIITNLWFDTESMEAAEFYVSVFPRSTITNVLHYGEAGPREAGTVMLVEFDLDGQPFTALDGGPQFQFNESISLVIDCADQAEVDHYWTKLTDGGEASQCGWLKDRYGVSWQVFPTSLRELLSDTTDRRGERAMQAMFGMQKIDIAALHTAANQPKGEAIGPA